MLEAVTIAELGVLRGRTLPQLVQREIERLILSGDLHAGERINEVAIARRIGVSRGPVREALRMLQEAGLLVFEKNRGVTVRAITPDEASDIYELRGRLEALVCERLAVRITLDQLAEVRDLVDQMDSAARVGDVNTYHPLNVRFHERLVEFAGSLEFSSVYYTLMKKLTLFRRHTLGQSGAISVSNAEHQEIVAQLAARKPQAAGSAMRRHILASSARMTKSLRVFQAGAPQNEEASSVGV